MLRASHSSLQYHLNHAGCGNLFPCCIIIRCWEQQQATEGERILLFCADLTWATIQNNAHPCFLTSAPPANSNIHAALKDTTRKGLFLWRDCQSHSKVHILTCFICLWQRRWILCSTLTRTQMNACSQIKVAFAQMDTHTSGTHSSNNCAKTICLEGSSIKDTDSWHFHTGMLPRPLLRTLPFWR